MKNSTQDQRGLDPEPDIVLEFIRITREIMGDLTQEQEQKMEHRMKSEHGGRRVRVLKRGKIPSAERRKEIVSMALESQDRMADVAKKNGISRAALYLYMKHGGKS